MSSASSQIRYDTFEYKSMQEFGEIFIEALPKHVRNLKIPGRVILENDRRQPVLAHIMQISELQDAMFEVLNHPITQEAQFQCENAFRVFFEKPTVDSAVLKFFNITFKLGRLKGIMLNYNERVGNAFAAMHQALIS